ncbi:DEAD/DEAH box helicase [bacterium]|nr:DEAD/DEAH box helicase [bacterium]
MEMRPLEKIITGFAAEPEVQRTLSFLKKGEVPQAPELFLYIVRHISAKERGEGIWLRQGKDYSQRVLRQKFSALGFVESPLVYEKGQFSFRGEVVDFWDNVSLYPVRLEFFDQTLERIYFFDQRSQKSLEIVDSLFVYPIKFSELKHSESLILCKPHSYSTFKEVIRLAHSSQQRVVLFSRYELALKALAKKAKIYFLPPLDFSGFSLGRWHFFTDKDFQKKIKIRRFKSITDFSVGDYVVHIDHGIAKLEGIGPKQLPLSLDEQVLPQAERREFYYHLRFQNNAYLYVPLKEKRRLTKYIGLKPHLSSLGKSGWEKTKILAEAEAEKLAKKLFALYKSLKRQKIEIKRFGQFFLKHLEKTCPFSLTPAQKKALQEIQNLLFQKRPFDHLLIGPAGSGKTEVALRVASLFLPDKQVVFLAPTTILAQQQYLVFKERLQNLPVRVALVCSLQKEKKNQEIIKKFNEGKIDLLIGTHKLLFASLEAENLGLAVIDEEQRFGVKQKEKWRLKNPSLSVLSLTATPIPRTLYLSLSKIKTMSVLEGWVERKIKDRVLSQSDWSRIEKVIKRAAKKKKGVYFVAPLIKDVLNISSKLKFMGFEVAVAHGRMPKDKLAQALSRFSLRKVDVLVATAIVEHGLDISGAQTMILWYGSRLGIGDLYQLRGRIGRAGQVSYFWVAVPKKLPDSSYERLVDFLSLIKEPQAFYKISLRDLEKRGEGEIFGKRQHGIINQVGAYLFSEMVSQAWEKIKQKD